MNTDLVTTSTDLAAADFQRMKDTLVLISKGAYLEDLVTADTFTMGDCLAMSKRDPVIAELLKEARKMGQEVRQIIRENAADRRAIEGVKEPIYSARGEYCGEKINYSDTLMALMLKANDPDKYGHGNSAPGAGVVLNVNLGLEREPMKTVEVENGETE